MSVRIYFNPLDLACKNVIGGIKEGETLQLNIFCLKTQAISSQHNASDSECLKTPNLDDCIRPDKKAYLLLNRDGEDATSYEMKQTAFGWSISFVLKECGLYYYVFQIESEGYVSCNNLETGELMQKASNFLLLVSALNYQTPEWFKGGVMYQIFPDRFCKIGSMPDITERVCRTDWGGIPQFRPNEKGKVLNNDYFGGNFQGIQSKLPYLKSLGVTFIYLNPIFEANSNHRYDTADYKKIDPFLGTEADFSALVKAAESLGIRIILDGVFNHTGDNSVYFNKYGKYNSVGAYQSKDSPYYSWYTFTQFPEQYESWWGIDILPEVNENSEDYQHFIFGEDGVLKKWLGFGIGGYRLDVADELPDFFLQGLRASVKDTNPEAVIIGEVWEDAADKVAYSKRKAYFQGHELDSVMNYPWKEAIIRYIQTGKAVDLLRSIRLLINHYPKQSLDCLMNILGTHDTARILTVLGGIYCQNKEEMAKDTAYLTLESKEIAIKKLKMAAILQYTLPGVPCLYYGDENGMEGHIDPFCRQCFDWEHLNNDLISFYKRLGEIRSAYNAIFKDGVFEELRTEDGLLYYKREKDKNSVYVFVNNSSKNYLLQFDGIYKNVLTNITFEKVMHIYPYQFGIFIKENIF